MLKNAVYIKTVLWSRQARGYLEKNGFQKTVEKYPTVCGRTLVTPNKASHTIRRPSRMECPTWSLGLEMLN